MPAEGDSISHHVGRTLRALELIALAPRSQAELARELAVHPRTARRLLARLESDGFATRSSDPRSDYSASLKIVTLAGHVLERTDVTKAARPFVARLQEETGETALLSIPAADAAVQVLREPARNEVAVLARLGERVPYHCAASGKALLAHLPARVSELLARPLERLTERTIVDPADLLLELARIRSRGWAEDDRECSRDVRSVAAPVFDHNREVLAAIGVSAPAHRLSSGHVERLGPLVAAVGSALSESLGYARTSGL